MLIWRILAPSPAASRHPLPEGFAQKVHTWSRGPSPFGRRWPEGPDEGSYSEDLSALTRPSATLSRRAIPYAHLTPRSRRDATGGEYDIHFGRGFETLETAPE
jgi:hypothetical protein